MSAMGRQKSSPVAPAASPVSEQGPSADAGNAARAESLSTADDGPSLLDRLSGATPLPHRAALEGAFGADLSGVDAFTGLDASAACEAVGAEAFAKGDRIAFRDEQPDPEVVAHEVAHVVQQRGAEREGVATKADEGPTLGEASAEAEADRAAADAVAGRSAEIEGHEGEAVRCYTPDRLTERTLPAEIDHDDANATTADATDRWVQPWTFRAAQPGPPNAPLAAPPVDALYHEWTPGRGRRPDTVVRMTDVRGTPESPVHTEDVIEPTLFVAHQPTLDDVRQGGIGDCWVMSALMSVVQADPAKLTSILTDNGASASMTLFLPPDNTGMLPGTSLPWNPKTYTAPKAGIALDGHVRGAGVRVPENPRESEWWGQMDGSVLTVNRRSTFEAAWWVTVAESIFGQWRRDVAAHVQPRDGAPAQVLTDDDVAQGQDALDTGGAAHTVWQALYGGQTGNEYVLSAGSQGHHTDADLLTANANLVADLLAVNAHQGRDRTMMSVSAAVPQAGDFDGGQNGAIQTSLFYRIGDSIDAALATARSRGLDHSATYEDQDVVWKLNILKQDWQAWTTRRDARELQLACDRVANIYRLPALHDGAVPEFSVLMEQLQEIVRSDLPETPSLGRDAEFTVADHAYTVLSSALVDHARQPVTSVPSDVTTIDTLESKVHLRNPWGDVTQTRPGQPDVHVPAEKDLTLHSFLHDFTHVDVGTATVTP